MVKEDFKPIYNADASSQYTLINQTFPDKLAQLMNVYEAALMHDQTCIMILYVKLKTLMPPFKKFIPDYDKEIEPMFNDCKILFEEWLRLNKQGNKYPKLFVDKLTILYDKFWEAYNGSGAGIRGTLFVPRDTRIKNAVRNL